MSMRAVNYAEYGNSDVLQLTDTPIPQPGDDEVLIEVRAASINPFDWKLRNGWLQDFFSPDFPITPGRDGCGTIVKLGKNVVPEPDGGLTIGRRVSFISSRVQYGALAEFVAVKAADFVAPAPNNLTDQQCAALPLGGLSAWIALHETAQARAGMKILIHGGSGGVGSIAVQIARHLKANVFATCSSANTGKVKALGATAIPYDRVAFENEVSDCDIVFDTVGGQVHERSYRVLNEGGCLVYLLAAPFRDLSAEYRVSTRQAVVHAQSRHLQEVMNLASTNIIKPLICKSLALDEYRKAFELGEAGKAGGKIVITLAQ